MIESWKDVIGYEGRYMVSDLGRVKSLLGKEEKILKSATTKAGAKEVSLSKDLKAKTFLVHFLVLSAFVGPRPGIHRKWHCCHEDGNASNNILNNLRWDTRIGNEADKIRHGTSNRGVNNGHCKLTQDDVLEIRKLIMEDKLSSDEIAEKFGVTRGLINAIKAGRAWKWL